MPNEGEARASLSVLIIDSDSDFRKSGGEVIARRGHRAFGAGDLIAAASLLHEMTPDLLMVELALIDMDGADPLADLRAQAPDVPLVLMASGAPSERFRALAPRHQVFGYCDKSHGEDGLIVWLDASRLLAERIETIRRMREQVRQVLEAVPELHKVQPLDRVLEEILLRVYSLMGSQGSFVAARVSDPIGRPPIEGQLSPNSIADYIVGAASGDFPTGTNLKDLDSVPLSDLRRAIEECRGIIKDTFGVLPLALGQHVLGLAYLDQPGRNGHHDTEILQLFASHAAAAIRNAALYELATVDSTTRVFRKSSMLERLRETVKLAWRKKFPVAVLMVDIDGFRVLNDEHGHVVGDRALRHAGGVLSAVVRDSDIVGRFGGDAFIVVLVDSDIDGARIVTERMIAGMMHSARPEGVPAMEMSIGIACLETADESTSAARSPDFHRLVETLIERADRAMYEARRNATQVEVAETLAWANVSRTDAS